MKYLIPQSPRILFLVAALLIPLNLATAQTAPGEGADKQTKNGGATEVQHVLRATVVEGIQVARVSVGPTGYSASRVAFQAGVPARLIFTRTAEGSCTHQVQIPALDIEATDLPVGEAVAFDFTPAAAGEFAITCGMGMVQGMVVVQTG